MFVVSVFGEVVKTLEMNMERISNQPDLMILFVNLCNCFQTVSARLIQSKCYESVEKFSYFYMYFCHIEYYNFV